MTNKYMKKCLTSLATKEIKIKTTLRFHLTLVRMAVVRNTNNNLFGEDAAKQEPFYPAGG
jgi:hypothetical protein